MHIANQAFLEIVSRRRTRARIAVKNGAAARANIALATLVLSRARIYPVNAMLKQIPPVKAGKPAFFIAAMRRWR